MYCAVHSFTIIRVKSHNDSPNYFFSFCLLRQHKQISIINSLNQQNKFFVLNMFYTSHEYYTRNWSLTLVKMREKQRSRSPIHPAELMSVGRLELAHSSRQIFRYFCDTNRFVGLIAMATSRKKRISTGRFGYAPCVSGVHRRENSRSR